MTERVERVNSLLEQEVGKIIRREVFFPNGAMVTVTRVETSGNIIEAKVYVSSYPEATVAESLQILKKATPFIQPILNKKLKMRPVPKIIFVLDKTISEADKVEALLHKLKEEGK